jgi:hypothetical protein
VKILVCGGTRYSDARTLDFKLGLPRRGTRPLCPYHLVPPSEHIVAGVLRILSRPVDELITQDYAEFPVLRLCAQIAGAARSIPIAHAVTNRCFARLHASEMSATDLFAVMVAGSNGTSRWSAQMDMPGPKSGQHRNRYQKISDS